MSYIKPNEFVQTMIDAGENKVMMSTRDTILRAAMGGAILAIAVAVAVTAAVQTGLAIVGALVFPVGFVVLNLMGFDLLTAMFALAPLALFDKRPNITKGAILRNWLLVALGNLIGAVAVAFLVALTFTMNFSVEPGAVGQAFIKASTARSLGFAEHGVNGWITVFVKGILCNWMVCLGVVGSMTSKSVSGKTLAMWFPIFIFFALVFEHAVVNMYLFPLGMMLGAEFTIMDWLTWNQLPVTLGNIVGGLVFTGGALYVTHAKTLPAKQA